MTAVESTYFQPDRGAHADKRHDRWRRRRRAQALARSESMRNPEAGQRFLGRLPLCGVPRGDDVTIRWDGKHCYAAGVMQCGSIWTCPTCAALIRTRREQELHAAAAEHCSRGGRLAMMTLTVRHDRSMSLDDTLTGLLRSWELLQMRKAFKEGIRDISTGYVRALEITYGENGWHPHLHVLFFVEPSVSDNYGQAVTDELFTDWRDLVTKELKRSPSFQRGIDFLWFGSDSAAAARYVTKITKEITFANTKSGRDPFALLDDRSPTSTALYIEYAKATFQKRAISWSLGLRAELLDQPEVTDDELLQELETIGVEVLTLSAALWKTLSFEEQLGWIEFAEAQHKFSSA